LEGFGQKNKDRVVLTAVLLIVSGALLATLYFVFTHRRHTPYLKLELDTLPPIEKGLSTLAGLTGGAVYKGNRLDVLQNGALYPAMKQDIARAKHTIHLESFVWTKGKLEREFVELLGRKAAEGCKVRVLIDAMGGISADKEQLKHLAESGAEVSIYCRPHWWNVRRFNHRTHRKLLIVDGAIGYTFGHGIADQWLGNGEDKDHWRDTAVRAEGPVVQALQSVFVENWIEEMKCVPSGEGCFPVLEKAGDSDAHVVSSASGEALSSVALLYTTAIACARREILIQNPYFAPDDGVCELLAMMVKRGVAIHLMVPGTNTDSPFVRRAGCHLYADLLQAGVRLYEFEPTLLHQKILVIDDIWSHIGSTNFDSRSLALNEEAGMGILDAQVAAELKKAFNEDLKRSQEIKLTRWQKRPLRARAFDWLAYQLHDQL
jgi:cardiolipin synthase